MIFEIADIMVRPGRRAEFEAAFRRGVETVVNRAKGDREWKVATASSAPGATCR